MPLCSAPDEACQFDWSREIVRINGVTVTVKVAHVRLCHSRVMPLRQSREDRKIMRKASYSPKFGQ